MGNRNRLSLFFLVVSFGLLIPGLWLPLVTITADMPFVGEVFRETRSIIQSIENLFDSGNYTVAMLILVFSVVVPIVKMLIMLVVFLAKNHPLRPAMHRFVDNISKWAMADVYAMGIFVAFLSAKATDALDAFIGEGFYYFVGYCICSLISLQLISEAELGLVKEPENS